MTSDPETQPRPPCQRLTIITNEHKIQKWRQFVETLDHKTDHTKLWRTIRAIDGKLTPNAGRHTSSRETRLVSSEIKRQSLTSAVTFTTDQVTKGLRSCSNTQAFGPDKLSIFHLKHLGSRVIEYLTALFNDSVTFCRIPSIWKSSTSSQSRNQTRTPLSALLISLSCSSVQQRKLWRISYFQPSTTTCFHPQTNTVSDQDTLPLLL